MKRRVSDYVQLIRPSHWVKNLFVFAPLVFSLNLLKVHEVLANVAAFFAFCIAASSVYVFNDIHDKKSDVNHPLKKKRPIASGRISEKEAWMFLCTLIAGAIFSSLYVSLQTMVVITFYIVMNILYTLMLKEIVIIDVMVIAIGFILRIMAGSTATHVFLSNWMLLTTFSISLFIGFSKRRYEIVSLGDKARDHRKVLAKYEEKFVDEMITATVATTIVFYSLYTIDTQVVRKFGTSHLVFTVPFVVYGLFRYLYVIHVKGKGGDPVEIVLKDVGIISAVVGWFVAVILLIYLK